MGVVAVTMGKIVVGESYRYLGNEGEMQVCYVPRWMATPAYVCYNFTLQMMGQGTDVKIVQLSCGLTQISQGIHQITGPDYRPYGLRMRQFSPKTLSWAALTCPSCLFQSSWRLSE
jgi:hypothetical protein